MLKRKLCRRCGRPFMPKRPWHRDCSPECHHQGKTLMQAAFEAAFERKETQHVS
jgi:hypothetical protein